MVLVIVLKRFGSGSRKNNTIVDYPLTGLDLSEFTYGYNRNTPYNLFGVCCHYGTVHGGHYLAYVKGINDQFFQYNDEHFSEIPNTAVTSCAQAYCLFYQIAPS